ncbi:MAG: hypothetical protein ACOZBH_00170 [Patescibacteria group bacterium]
MGKDRHDLLAAGRSLGMIQEIIRQVREGKLTPEHLQALIERRNPFISEERKTTPITLDRILEALNKFKFAALFFNNLVITAEQAAKAWKLKVPTDAAMRYSEATLDFWLSRFMGPSSLDTDDWGTDWRLIYINGLSLKEQFNILGQTSKGYLSFSNGCPRDERKPEAGYYLIGMEPFSSDFAQRTLDNFGDSFEPCHPAVFAEALFTVHMTHGCNYATTCFHQYLDELEGFPRWVSVGYFRRDIGLKVLEKSGIVYSEPTILSDDMWRVYKMALCRRFDF